MIEILGSLLGGLVLLTIGAEALVRGASKLALSLGIPALVVGLTVVAYGTSAPEMAVSVASAIKGQADLAIGNVVGSNIFNVLFILGVAALILPLTVSRTLAKIDVPVMIGVSAWLWWMCRDGVIGFMESAALFLGLVAYTYFQIQTARKSRQAAMTQEEKEARSVKPNYGLLSAYIIGGLGLLIVGSRFFVTGAIDLAKIWGISDTVIGLTIVAAGTSLPEVATSIMATIRGERDIAIGNVVGSNIFNILGVLGVSGLASPSGLPVNAEFMSFDIPIMIAVAVICVPAFITNWRISRLEGALFLGFYILYTLSLVYGSTGQIEAFAGVKSIFYFAVIPISLLWCGLGVRAWFKERTRPHAA